MSKWFDEGTWGSLDVMTVVAFSYKVMVLPSTCALPKQLEDENNGVDG